LGEAWERYNEFEEYRYYDKSLSLHQFVTEWESRLAAAVAAGCEYNDTVLAFKLLDRVQLAEEENRAVLATLAAAAARGGHHHEDDDMLALLKVQLTAQFRQELKNETGDVEGGEDDDDMGTKANIVKHENGGSYVDYANTDNDTDGIPQRPDDDSERDL
jgi:hypothetical protein